MRLLLLLDELLLASVVAVPEEPPPAAACRLATFLNAWPAFASQQRQQQRTVKQK